MTTTIINNAAQYTFGALTNQATSRLISANTQLLRLRDAIATASAGYDGEPGTQFEITTTGNPNIIPNLFGVLAGETPGEQGQAYAYAVGRLVEEWTTFWSRASDFIEQLDNGVATF